jgi:hypothetical protein
LIYANKKGSKFSVKITRYLLAHNIKIFIKTVADTPNRLYIDRFTWVVFYLLPEIMDMAHDDIDFTIIL